MAFHGIMVLRDEGDIVAQVLTHLLTWVDSLHVYDTGSTDGTWEIVEEAARGDRRGRAVGGEDGGVGEGWAWRGLLRYRLGWEWPVRGLGQLRGGGAAVERFRVRRHGGRGPGEAAARCAVRRAMREAGANVGPHWGLEDWREWLAN